MNRIHALESLRGLLASWVVVGHTILHCGYSVGDLGFFKLLAQPGMAVDVFIILSGFVIFFLLDQQGSSYPAFIVKRWFRLAPVFFAALLVAVLTLQWQIEIIDAFPWKNVSVLNDLAIHLDAAKYLPQQLTAHLLLLHGAVSDKLLPSSQYAFVGQAWSISVEWQFYLLAPLIYGLIASKVWSRVGLLLLILCALRAWHYGGEGFVVNQSAFFIIGIGSYYIWKRCDEVDISPGIVGMVSMALAALVYLLLSRAMSLLVWIAVLSCVVAEKKDAFTPFQRLLSKTLNIPTLQALGKISYSIYMTHMLVLYAVTWALLTLYPAMSQPLFLAAMVPAVLLLTILLSALTYRFCERPGMKAGKILAQRIQNRRSASRVAVDAGA